MNPQLNPKQEAQNELIKESIKSETQEKGKLDNAIKKASRKLLSVKCGSFFDFTPNEIIIDEEKVSIIERSLGVENIRSILIDEIAQISANLTLFSASLEIIGTNFKDEPIILNFLKRADATLARTVIEGLKIAKKEGIDFSKVEEAEIIPKLRALGKDHESQ